MSEPSELQPPLSAAPLAGEPARRHARRRRRVWLTIPLLLLAGAGWLSHFAYLRITLHPEPRTAYWEAKLAAIDPPPPGAIPSTEAYDLLTKRSFEAALPPFKGSLKLQYRVDEALRGPWNMNRHCVGEVSAVFQYKVFEDARLKMREAARAGWKEPANLGPLGDEYEAWTSWLLAHSRWALTRGDYAAARDDWLTTARLIRQRERGRTASGVREAGALRHCLACELTQAANEGAVFPETSVLVREMDAVLGPMLPASEVVAGYRWQMYAYLDAVFVRRGQGWLDVSAAVAELSGGRPPSRWWNLTSGVFHDYTTACRNVERAFAGLERCRTGLACGRLLAERRGEDALLDSLELSPPPEIAMWHYYSMTRLDAGLAGLALREYRRRHGAYPNALAELVPETLPRTPIDYVDGAPLRYRRSSAGYLLYSVGENGVDDGGNGRRTSLNQLDIVFSSLEREESTD